VARYRIVFAPTAARQLKRLTRVVQRRIVQAIAKLSKTPPLGKHLRGELKDYWSYRVGDYRVIYFMHRRRLQIEIIRVAHRRESYR
jgi:mRNA interferase RelE/StbE